MFFFAWLFSQTIDENFTLIIDFSNQITFGRHRDNKSSKKLHFPVLVFNTSNV
jgi:hypothetical protein